MNELDTIFEKLVEQETISKKKLADALQNIDLLKGKYADLSEENIALRQEAFIFLKKLYRSYNERERAFDTADRPL